MTETFAFVLVGLLTVPIIYVIVDMVVPFPREEEPKNKGDKDDHIW